MRSVTGGSSPRRSRSSPAAARAGRRADEETKAERPGDGRADRGQPTSSSVTLDRRRRPNGSTSDRAGRRPGRARREHGRSRTRRCSTTPTATTWTYTSPEALRLHARADHGRPDRRRPGGPVRRPAAGTDVVTVGVAELVGTEYGRRGRLTQLSSATRARRHDALDRRLQPAVPLPRGRAGRRDDVLRRPAAARDAGRRLPRVRAAARRDPDRVPRAVRGRGRGAGHASRWSRR